MYYVYYPDNDDNVRDNIKLVNNDFNLSVLSIINTDLFEYSSLYRIQCI